MVNLKESLKSKSKTEALNALTHEIHDEKLAGELAAKQHPVPKKKPKNTKAKTNQTEETHLEILYLTDWPLKIVFFL